MMNKTDITGAKSFSVILRRIGKTLGDAFGNLNKNGDAAFFLILVFIAFFRFLFCGFEYGFTLDDYIQYHNLPSASDYVYLISSEGLFAARPLAAIFDLYIYAPFFDNMIIGLFISSLSFATSAFVFYKAFSRLFSADKFFVLFYLLFPLNFEGTYWLSASVRITSGMLFTSLAILFLYLFCETKKHRHAVCFVFFQLISQCFYEQILVLSLAMSIIIMIFYLIKGNKLSLIALHAFSNTAIYFMFTKAFGGSGAISSRMELVLPNSEYYFKIFLPELTDQMKTAFIDGGVSIFFKGIKRGFSLIFSENGWLYLAIAMLCAIVIFYIAKRKTENKKISPDMKSIETRGEAFLQKYTSLVGLIFAILIFIAPIAPFFIIANPWFSLRGTVASMLGASLILDIAFRFITKERKVIYGVVSGLFVFLSLIASASETYDYIKTCEYDNLIIEKITKITETNPDGSVGIINLNSSFLEEQNFLYHEHISSVCSSDWALYGMLVCKTKKEYAYSITPLAADGEFYYKGWNKTIKQLDNFKYLYFWDEKERDVTPLTKYKLSDTITQLNFADGALCATVTENDDYAYIELYDRLG